MSRPLKYTARAKQVRPLFETPDEEFNIQLARLIVFYEDLRLEVAGSANREIPDLDETGKQYRELYFVRRAFATVDEIRGALNQINQTDQMTALRIQFSQEQQREWEGSIKFFNKNADFIGHQRSLYGLGGHFLHKTAKFVIARLDSNRVGIIGVHLNHVKRSARVVFKFALELVGIGLTADRAEKNVEQFIAESFDLLVTAMRQATSAIHLISDHHILKKFGFL